MRTIAPLELAESSWDNVGVLVGKLKRVNSDQDLVQNRNQIV